MTARILAHRGEHLSVAAHFAGGRVTLRDATTGATRDFEAKAQRPGEWLLCDPDGQQAVHVARQGDTWWVHAAGRTWVLEAITRRAGDDHGAGSLEAPMTGKVLAVLVAEGDRVNRGQPLVVLSAMKMQVEVKSPLDGVVRRLPHRPDDQVEGGTPLALVEPEGPSA